MKIKTILAFVFLCSSFQTVKGQTNNIYMELLGVGGMGSINYERMIIKDKLFARSSYGGFSFVPLTFSLRQEKIVYDDYGNEVGSILSDVNPIINPLCLGAHYMFGKKWKVEIGGGISYWKKIKLLNNNIWGKFYTSVGFRYQKPEGGINVKLGLSHIFMSVQRPAGDQDDYGEVEGEESVEIIPWPHIGLGYSF